MENVNDKLDNEPTDEISYLFNNLIFNFTEENKLYPVDSILLMYKLIFNCYVVSGYTQEEVNEILDALKRTYSLILLKYKKDIGYEKIV